MTPDEWEKLQSAFEEALALEEGAVRAAFIAALHAEDPAFAAEVQQMIDADVSSDDALSDPVHAMAASLGEKAADRWVGTLLGNYRVTRKIATGGMSAVYLAERADEQFDQAVAIKIVGQHALSEELKLRFGTERQILASLQHPNIAQLLDGGTTEDGTPYLVMEYVDGTPITRYCDANLLSIEQRLRLFMKVCDAVDYAHRNLVVHRDIKPSNILVMADGIPKLLDFGIAKPLDGATMKQTIAMTQASARAMTPEYASPEQVRGEKVSTATDVYSLGVLLYKLLSGRMPYLLKDRGIDSFVNAILDTVPDKPSTVITLTGEKNDRAPAIVAQRSETVSGLRKLLSGDLDTITLKTLQKEPDRRYPSARALRDDVARYLASKPVAARPDSLGYRAGKFARRHRVGVAGTVAVTAAIVSLVTYYTWQLTIERNRAEAEATKATQVVDFLTGVFRSASPFYSRGEEPSVRDLLSQGAKQIETELAGQPEIRSELLNRIALIHQDLGMFDEAATLYEQSLDAARTTFGDDDPRLAGILLNMSSASREAFAFDNALALAEEALAIAEAAAPPEPSRTAAAWHTIGNTYAEMHEFTLSVSALRKAVDAYEALLPETDENYALAMHDLGNGILNVDGPEAALPVILEAHALELDAFGDAHPAIAKNLSLQAVVYQLLGDMQESERLHRAAFALIERLYGREHPEYGIALSRLANFLSSRERWEEIEPMLDEALVILAAHFPPDHFWVSTTRGMLSEVYSETGRNEAALSLAGEWLEESVEQWGELDWSTAIAYAEYADALLEASREDDAIRAYRKSITAFEANDGGAVTAYTRSKLGRALLLSGRVADADPVIREALADVRSSSKTQPGLLGRVVVAYGELAVAQADYASAREAAAEALELFAAGNEGENSWYWLARIIDAAALHETGRSDAARAELELAIRGLSRDNGTRSRIEDRARALLASLPGAPEDRP